MAHAAMDASAEIKPAAPRRRQRLLFLLPIAAFFGLVVTFVVGLHYDPRLVPSPLVGKRVPQFSLPPAIAQKPGLASADLRGKVSLVNVFASWCVDCRYEQSLLLVLAQRHIVPVEGIDYKDAPADAARWLAKNGDPYDRIGADAKGRIAIDWGVYGVPETFVVGPGGRIAYKQVGPLTASVLERKILPLVTQLRQGRHPVAGTGG